MEARANENPLSTHVTAVVLSTPKYRIGQATETPTVFSIQRLEPMQAYLLATKPWGDSNQSPHPRKGFSLINNFFFPTYEPE